MSMSHYLSQRAGRPDETLTAYAVIELNAGTNHKGYGADIEVEVRFTQSPIVKCSSFCRIEDSFPDEGGEREPVSIEATRRLPGGKIEYLEMPKWLETMLWDCIDIDALEPMED